jgi:hypothetical protein
LPAERTDLPIDLPTVSDLQDENGHDVVVDFVKHAVVPDTEAKDARFPCERLHARRTRGVLQGEKPFVESFLNVLRKRHEGAFGGRLEDEAVASHLYEPRLPADLLVGHGPRFFAGGQDGGHVEAVLKVFEEFQVFNGHEGGDGLPVTLKHDPLTPERHAVKRVGECISNGCSGNADHGSLCTL